MIRDATAPIPTERLSEHRSMLCSSAVPPLIEYQASTDFLDTDAFNQELADSKLRFRLRGVGALAVSLMVGHYQALDAQEPSRAIADVQTVARTLRDLGGPSSNTTVYPVADFYEPVQFTWSKKGHMIRQAAKQFSEQTHADY